MIDKLRKFFYARFRFLVRLYHFMLALLSAIIYRFPSRKIFVAGVTGTKGKTTTLEILNAILEAAGKKTALCSSLRTKIGRESRKNDSGNTMPGRFFLQSFCQQAVKSGCDYALIEVTSQGVALSRHRFIKWRMGAITNLAPEHIESHGSFEKYREAKLKFLRRVLETGGLVFLNKNDSSADFFAQALGRNRVIFYSKDELFGLPISELLDNSFNRENAAAAVALARNIGIEEEVIKSALGKFSGLPGRMEFVQREPFTVVVDYAHTPQSLELIYKTLRSQKSKVSARGVLPRRIRLGRRSVFGGKNQKLICVLGSAGGGRDKWKRPEMGKIAAEYCDKIILTDEDPYDENPVAILEEIEAGFLQIANSKWQIGRNYWKILDRREAILRAISVTHKGDIVVLTGKGSESWIHESGGRRIIWDERREVERILAEAKEKKLK